MLHPHILIATPQALLDVISRKPTDSDSSPQPLSQTLTLNLSTVLVDEIDSMLALPPRDANQKKLDAWYRHVPTIVDVLDSIYGMPVEGKKPPARPQLVVASATLNAQTRQFMYSKPGWVAKPSKELVDRLDYSSHRPAATEDGETTQRQSFVPDVVRHSCVIVGEEGEMRNISLAEREEDPIEGQREPLSKTAKKRLRKEAADFSKLTLALDLEYTV